MKAKLKDPLVAKKKGFGHVKTTLKKLLKEEITEATPFFYDSEFDYGGADGKKPLLFIGELPIIWKNYIKKNKTLKTVAAGNCLFKDGMLSLQVMVGKGAKPLVLKEVQKALFRPFAEMQFVESVETVLVAVNRVKDKTTEDDAPFDTATKEQYIAEATALIAEAKQNTGILDSYIKELKPEVTDLSAKPVTDKLITKAINVLVAVHNLDINSFLESTTYWISNVPKDLLDKYADLKKVVEDLEKAKDALMKSSVNMDLISKDCEKLKKVQNPKDSSVPPVDNKAFMMLMNGMMRVSTNTKEFINQATEMFKIFKGE